MHDLDPLNETTHIGYQRIAKAEKTQWVRHQFDTVARRYDFMNTLLSCGIHYLWKRITLDMLNPRIGDRVLDLCGGTGDLAVSAKKRVGMKGRVVLCDINREMMTAGKTKPAHASIRRSLDYVQGDAESMPFPDASFDAAVVGFGIRNLTDMDRGFQEMYRILKPGGAMVCLEFSNPKALPVRKLYHLYSFHLMPRLGALFIGSREAYTYLPESIRLFPSPDVLASRLADIGFKRIEYRRLSLGIAVIHRGMKTDAGDRFFS
ncbi:MAG: bifunctional demethylmenaquinone methyltransferase/2-methoxy-6-polyprenyl-1,4-benzoquinol methylase UbiE [Thermodesulfobacteriota bacterium]